MGRASADPLWGQNPPRYLTAGWFSCSLLSSISLSSGSAGILVRRIYLSPEDSGRLWLLGPDVSEHLDAMRVQ